MSLDDFIAELSQKGLVRKEEIGLDQVRQHLARAKKDLKTAKAALRLKIDDEASYNYAYLAMLRTARALVFLEGYRPVDGSQHKTVISLAGAILGEKYKAMAEEFEEMRQRRNKFTYEPGIPVSDSEAEEAAKIAEEWVKQVSALIAKKNPQLELL